MRSNRPKSNQIVPSPFVVETLRTLSLAISKVFWRIEFINTENIPKNPASGLVIASNHLTYFDPFWISIPVKHDLRFLAWDEAFEWFFLGNMIRKAGAFPVSLKSGGTIKALKKSLEYLRSGKSLVVFPEGERGFSDGKLHTFKTGTARLAIEANVPILPVTIKGANKVWSRDHKFPRPGKVQIIYHPILQTALTSETENEKPLVKKTTQDLVKIIASAL